jgi:hypothetical protein
MGQLLSDSSADWVWKDSVTKRICSGDLVRLLAPHPDAGLVGIVRLVESDGVLLELVAEANMFVWAGSSTFEMFRPRSAE